MSDLTTSGRSVTRNSGDVGSKWLARRSYFWPAMLAMRYPGQPSVSMMTIQATEAIGDSVNASRAARAFLSTVSGTKTVSFSRWFVCLWWLPCEQRRVEHHAEGVVDGDGRREGAVAALVREHPDA